MSHPCPLVETVNNSVDFLETNFIILYLVFDYVGILIHLPQPFLLSFFYINSYAVDQKLF